ncbi:MAG: hypothetical protein ABUL62_05555 [Myxococcales bacterium]
MPSAGAVRGKLAFARVSPSVESCVSTSAAKVADHPHLAAQAAARKLARSEASTSEHGAEQQVWGWWARAEATPSTRPASA